MKQFFTPLRYVLPIVGFFLTSTQGAQAQHDGPPSGDQAAYGVNRRVETSSAVKGDTTGYGGISGTFSEPDMALDSVFSPSHSAPQFYLGLGCDAAGVQLDAGLVYEARLEHLGGATTGKWQSFINYNHGDEQANGKDPNHPRLDWSVPRGALGDRTVSVNVSENGTMILSVSGGATNPQDVPVTVEQLPVTSAVAQGLYVKRVTAMTQPGAYVLNDTWIKNSTFTIGTISTIAVKDGKFQPTNRKPNLWDATTSKGTGYSPRDRDGHQIFIVDFPGLYARNPNGSDPPIPADYYSKPETMNISLLRVCIQSLWSMSWIMARRMKARLLLGLCS